ncbi:UNVERIFIED_CONTAM: hypothetical protein GTU68_007452 [Idotea baltica]|nr:hypothetical protein [Idotea baltica]
MTNKAALISVSNRDGLVNFAKSLTDLGYTILSTKGTATFLEENGVSATRIEKYIDQKEILGGRVKTLHPKIHAGILARREVESDLAELKSENIFQIDIVAVNLYPFIEKIKQDLSEKEMIESVDIGGPTMIRAAAKNFSDVSALIDPSDYDEFISKLKNDEANLEYRKQLAIKVFAKLADYNLQIAKYFKISQELRYGENPHQSASVYLPLGEGKPWKQLQGKELSYNNFLDFDAASKALKTASRLSDKPGAVIIKHLNPCGGAFADTLEAAIKLAKEGDPISHFGGIIALNKIVDKDSANNIAKDFAEIVIAPKFSPESVEILSKKKNLRLIELDLEKLSEKEVRSLQGAVLEQTSDEILDRVTSEMCKTKRSVTEKELEDINFAWVLCAHVKSNAIVLVKDNKLLASGGGQMSRIDATDVALMKANKHKHNLEGSVAASDAFFPFTDCVEVLAEAGVKAIVAPFGAKKDQEVIDIADKLGISLLHAQNRHFRH